MTYKLYVDDLQPIPDGFEEAHCSFSAITMMCERGCPSLISFDYDLGQDDTAMVVINWMINRDIKKNGTFIPIGFDFLVHSFHAFGAANIECKLRQYLDER